MLWLLAFAAGFVVDIVWALWACAVQYRQPCRAANMSVLIYICSVVSTLLIVEKQFLAVFAYLVGGWLGTYLIVKRRT
jgi:hypothetical protein